MSFIVRRDGSPLGGIHVPSRLLGEFDLRRIRQGRHQRLWQVFGAHTTGSGTTFSVWAPSAREVRVAGDLDGREGGSSHRMLPIGSSGIWELYLPGVGDGYRYMYDVLGADGQWRRKADPFASAADRPPGTASVVFTSGHRWRDAAWLERRARTVAQEEPMSVYEVHLGSWRPGLTYRELAEALPPYAAGLGFTHVEFMPVAEHTSDERLPTALYAPTARYGDPDDFRRLVDRLHQAGVGVILDWTPLRFAADEEGLARFDGTPLYEAVDAGDGGPRVPGGAREVPAAHAFDHRSPWVRNFLTANALHWCSQFHIDGLRTSGYPGDRDPEAVAPFFREVNSTLHWLSPGTVAVAEAAGAAEETAPLTGVAGPGFDLRWNTGWTQDCLGYLARDPGDRRYHHGEIIFPMVYAYSERHILPVSHAAGSLSSALPGGARRRRAGLRGFLAFMWAHPGKKLLFMGQEFAHEGEWDEPVGLRWEEADEGVRTLVRDLNAAYRRLPALWRRDASPDGFGWIVPDAASDNVLAFLRYDGDGTPLVCVCNFSAVAREGYRVGLPFTGRWAEVINTDAAPYGGSGLGNLGAVEATASPWHRCEASASMVLPPLSTLWLRPDSRPVSDKVSAP
ncbi:1,4-alpha-glucan branching enzyme [Sphaerisporangium sp. NPDC004334]